MYNAFYIHFSNVNKHKFFDFSLCERHLLCARRRFHSRTRDFMYPPLA